MEVFRLQKPIATKIESFVNERKTAGKIPTNQIIKYLDFQPDEGFIQVDNIDGAIAVYASGISFPESGGSNTEDQNDLSMITIDSYGFGDPVPKDLDENDAYPTSREAQKRAEVLLTLSYQAIMDRREQKGSPDENIEKMFGSGVDVGVDKYPVSVQKFDTIGTMQSKRGVCIYRLIIKFGLQELTREEELGLIYDGSDNIESETFFPNTEFPSTIITSDGFMLATSDGFTIITGVGLPDPIIPTLLVTITTSDGLTLETSDNLSIISYNTIY